MIYILETVLYSLVNILEKLGKFLGVEEKRAC